MKAETLKAETLKAETLKGEVLRLAAKLSPERARMVVEAIAAHDRQQEEDAAAGRAFETAMQPVRNALVTALQSGDVEAMRDLRALLPGLLSEIGPELEDHLAWQIGREVLGRNAERLKAETLKERSPDLRSASNPPEALP